MKSGTLYLIPATLGNLKSGDPSALITSSLPAAVLNRIREIRVFAVENAKSARALLKVTGSALPLRELEIGEIGHSPDSATLRPFVDHLIQGRDVGLMSEAGCPGIADPGAQLARIAHGAGIRVAPLVGPSSILLALMASGLDGQHFAFAGYLPIKPPARDAMIATLEARSRKLSETQILIETPYRNGQLFAALIAGLNPATRMAVAADLTLPEELVAMKAVGEWRCGPPPALDRRPAVFLFLAG